VKEPKLSWLKAFATASLGKKYFMGLSGLFLCFFLVVHLAGNLLLYVGDETYNEYAHKLHSNAEFLLFAEVLLYTAFVFHIGYGIWLHFGNRAARDQRYAFVQSKREDRKLNPAMPTPDRTMFITGLIILMYLSIHLSDFKGEVGWESQFAGLTAAQKAQTVVSSGFRSVVYLVAAIVLGVHVSHGFQSAFQSLGLNHSKYTPTIRKASVVFGFVVAIGFGSFPVVAKIRNWGNVTPAPAVEQADASQTDTPPSHP